MSQITAADSLTARVGATQAPENRDRQSRSRRISYFMLFRLVMLAFLTVMAGAVMAADDREPHPIYIALVSGLLVTGYALTVGYAWVLPRTKNLSRFAAIQTVGDIVLSGIAVHLSGGIESGFVFLYLLAILGAAIMGERRLVWATAAACLVLYLLASLLQLGNVVMPFGPHGDFPPAPTPEQLATLARSLAAMVGVTALSAYLNFQLESSASQIGNLRALNENIVRSLTSGLLTLDRDDRLVYFNPIAGEILGLDDQSMQKPISAVLPGFEQLDPGRSGHRNRLDLELDRGGYNLHLGLSTAPLLDDEGKTVGRIINFQDVTRLHQLAERARRNERLAAIGTLSASVAHEVRNPLAAISGSAELLAQGEHTDEDDRLLSIIHRESSRLSKLVSDLLQFTRPAPPQPVRMDLAQALAEVRDSFRSDPANADIDVQFGTEGPVEAPADPSQITQVVWNLMRNASDAMEGSGHIWLDVRRRGDQAIIKIQDDGPGIPREHLDRIFDPFFTTKESGTGFGLSVVHRIVDDHGGTMRVDSRLGQGTTFTISLPMSNFAGDSMTSGVFSLPPPAIRR